MPASCTSDVPLHQKRMCSSCHLVAAHEKWPMHPRHIGPSNAIASLLEIFFPQIFGCQLGGVSFTQVYMIQCQAGATHEIHCIYPATTAATYNMLLCEPALHPLLKGNTMKLRQGTSHLPRLVWWLDCFDSSLKTHMLPVWPTLFLYQVHGYSILNHLRCQLYTIRCGSLTSAFFVFFSCLHEDSYSVNIWIAVWNVLITLILHVREGLKHYS